MKIKNIFIVIVFLTVCLLPLNVWARDYKADDPDLYELMDNIPGELFPFATDSTIYKEQFSGGPNIHIYAPDDRINSANKVLEACNASYNKYMDLFQMGGQNPVVHIFVIKTHADGEHGRAANSPDGTGYLVTIAAGASDNIYHTTIHELMHVFQRAKGLRKQGTTHRWFVEGPAQFSPIIVGAPEHMVNKRIVYFESIGNGRFEQAVKQAHGKSMVNRQELACLFWYYYFKKTAGGSLPTLSSTFFQYKDNGFSNEGMDWFNFKDYWHDFALAHINEPGQKTDVFSQFDPNFDLVQSSALDEAEIINVPYEEEIILAPLSQQYFEIDNLDFANGAVVFSLPEKNIPEGLTISAVLEKSEGEPEWINIDLDEQALGQNWVKRFPANGKKYLDCDTDTPYIRIAFVFSNYLDNEEVTIKPVISGTLYRKYSGRGVETSSGTKYVMFGNIPLPGDQHLLKTGEGYRMYTFKDEIRTEARNLWFERVPPLEFGSEDLDKKAMRYVQANGIFRGKVYFKFKAIIPEKITGTGNNKIEEGKIKVVREKKEKFYDSPDTPNYFKVRIDKQDLLIMFTGDTKAIAKFVNEIEKIVKEKYATGTYGHTLSQLFQQTIALDTRQYNQEYDVEYKRGKDENGRYLKIKLAESMWFILRQVAPSDAAPGSTSTDSVPAT